MKEVFDQCRQKQIAGCKNCQFYVYGECKQPKAYGEEEKQCGFDEKELCTRKCIYFDTCTRNPNRKEKKR